MFSEDNLDFVNRLRGVLRITLSEAASRAAPNMLNLKAAPSAKIVSVKFEASLGDEDMPLTDLELDRLVFDAPNIQLRGDTGDAVVIDAPSSSGFTLRALIAAIEETELQTRGASSWLGGIDVHHVFFEGLFPEKDGTWSIAWGS